MAIMEERWAQMEAGNGHQNGGYAAGGKGAATGDSAGLPGSISNQYLARMTQYYTEGNQVRESVRICRSLSKYGRQFWIVSYLSMCVGKI